MSKKSRKLPTFGWQQDNHKASTKRGYTAWLLEKQKAKQESKGKINGTLQSK
jgi:hypothetical protein